MAQALRLLLAEHVARRGDERAHERRARCGARRVMQPSPCRLLLFPFPFPSLAVPSLLVSSLLAVPSLLVSSLLVPSLLAVCAFLLFCRLGRGCGGIVVYEERASSGRVVSRHHVAGSMRVTLRSNDPQPEGGVLMGWHQSTIPPTDFPEGTSSTTLSSSTASRRGHSLLS